MRIRIILIVFFLPILSFAQNLDLQTYLEQVKTKNPTFRGAVLNSEAATEKESDGGLEFSPIFFSQAEYMDDQGPRQTPAFQGDQTKNTSYLLGLSKKTRFGLDAKLSYNVGRTQISGTNPQFVPVTDYYGNTLKLELSQSLWQNALGRNNRLREQTIVDQNKARSLNESFVALTTVINAEKTYWNLAFSTEISKVQKESLRRAKEILSYNKNRKAKNLSDKSDVLQAQAGYELRLLDTEAAENNLRQITQSFNSMRGENSHIVSMELLTPTVEQVLALAVTGEVQLKLDTLAAQKNRDAAQKTSESAKEKFKPDLQLYGSVATGSLDGEFSNAFDDSISSKNPITSIGVRLSIPLDRSIVNSVTSGLSKEVSAAELQYQRKVLDNKVEWDNLVRKLTEAKARLSISKTLEKSQLYKLTNEKKMQKRGRSTTFQVLLFEQDYLNAQISTLRLMNETLSTYADLKSFGRL